MKHEIPLVKSILATRSNDPDDKRMEYMFRLTLLAMSVTSCIFTIVSVVASARGRIPLDTPIILAVMDILFAAGWIAARGRYWKIARIIPVAVIYAVALYGNCIGGIGAPAMVIYVLAMTLASTMFGRRALTGVMVLSIGSYAVIAFLIRSGVITAPRTDETVFLNRTLVAAFSMLGVGVLLNFLLRLVEEALTISRSREADLEVSNARLSETLEDLNAKNRAIEAQNRELEIRESKFSTLFRALADMVLILDSSGRIEEINHAALVQTGFAKTEMMELGFPGLSCFPDRDLKRVSDVIRTKSASRFETSLKKRGGQSFPVEASVTAVFIGGEAKAICVIRNITERKWIESERDRVQTQLIPAQQMEVVGTLASGIAHDFNNMRGGITGALSLIEILLDRKGTPRDDRIFEYLETALKSSERAAGVTKQLHMLSRKNEPKRQPNDQSDPLAHEVALSRNSLPKSGSLSGRSDPEPLRVSADPIQMEQVILNLCVNASPAMTIRRKEGERQGGTITLSAGYVTADTDLPLALLRRGAAESFVRIAVEDSGVGMSEETKSRIFDPFFTMKGRNQGTGLGMSMVYRIVEQHGGGIDVRSELGIGTVVSVFLPALLAEPGTVTAPLRDDGVVSGNKSILVIDDEISLLEIARGVLEEAGYRVYTASNGAEGLSLFRESPGDYDAILLDLSMPGLSGREVIQEIRRSGSAVPVLLTSGLIGDDEAKLARESEPAELLGKPYTASELTIKIAGLLKGSKAP